MQEDYDDDDEYRGRRTRNKELDLYESGLSRDAPLPSATTDLTVSDDSPKPPCWSPGHCCNITCTLKAYGAGGYSLENALLYTNTVYQLFSSVGVFDSTWLSIIGIMALLLITISLTSGNYPSNRNIVGRLLSRSPYFSAFEQRSIVPSSRNTVAQSRFPVNGIIYTILRVLIPSISVYRITKALFNRISSIEAPILIYIIVGILAILSVPFALAFFDEGRNDQTVLDPDATFVEENPNRIEFSVDIESDQREGFSRVIANPSLPRFENSEQLLESTEPNPIEVSPQRCGSSLQCIIQHSGSVGYGFQNAALNFDTAYQNSKNWGSSDSYIILSGIGLTLITSSITVQNYFSAHTMLDNYLPKFFNKTDNTPELESTFDRFKDRVGSFNAWPSTMFKVTIATVNFFGVTTRLFFGYWQVALPLTLLISPAGLLATAGLFSIKSQAKKAQVAAPENRIELLPDDDELVSDAPPNRWALREQENESVVDAYDGWK